MYYKIRALAALGKRIILHYFDYRKGRGVNGLESCCQEIHAYPRKPFWQALPIARPFIVSSRVHTTLLRRLEADDHPILLEGIHCAGLIPHLKNPGRVVLRVHNDEARYYRQLAGSTQQLPRKLYFLQEAKLLHRFQLRMDRRVKLALLSQSDLQAFRDAYHFVQVHFIPCFIPWKDIRGADGKGWYCLYHGNMEVAENEAAAAWLIETVFHSISIPLVIAGRGISARLKKKAAGISNIRFIENPPMDELSALIRDAHIHVLPSRNRTGVKLKLLHALFEGRFCLTNTAGVAGSGLEAAVTVADEPQDFKTAVETLWETGFDEAVREKRKALLGAYDTKLNAARLSALW